MSERAMVQVRGANFRTLVAAQLVARKSYISFLQAAGRGVPPPLARTAPGVTAVTWASQTDAMDYCRWLGKQEGHAYRLPSTAELVAFYAGAEAEGVSPGIWPADAERQAPDCVAHDACFCEWTCESEEAPIYGTNRVRVMGSIFYPPWLREGANASHVEAHMLATEGYSFISFRVAEDA
jgi:formylglycine-generating enzyme required for sulfatase activity